MIKFLKDNFTWLKDIGLVFFMFAILYFNANYVTNERFEASVKANDLAHQGIQTTLVSVDKTLALMQQNNAILIENEKAIKDLVSISSAVEVRLKLIENLGIEQRLKDKTLKLLELELRLKAIERTKTSDLAERY